MSVTLLIPELVWSNPDDPLAFAAAAETATGRLLARCPPVRKARVASEQALAEAAGWPAARPAPLAALRLAGECSGAPEPRGDHWLCADPVHLRFHQDRLILGDASQLALTADEAGALTASLAAALSPVALYAPHPERWYLRLPDFADDDLGSPPPSLVTGRALHPGQLGASRRCRQLANEIQILLHEHPVNTARAARGMPPVNSLWLWGGGALPGALPPLAAPAGCAPMARGLHRLATGTPAPAPASFSAWRANGPAAPTIAYLDSLLAAAHYQDTAAYGEAWVALDRDWLIPALRALRTRQIDRLQVTAPTAYGCLHWRLQPRDPWQAALVPDWLRRGPTASLATLAQQLASAPTP